MLLELYHLSKMDDTVELESFQDLFLLCIATGEEVGSMTPPRTSDDISQ